MNKCEHKFITISDKDAFGYYDIQCYLCGLKIETRENLEEDES